MSMIHALIRGVMWPPSYYVMRDRIPFFLTILYLFRSRIPLFNKYTQARLGIVLTLETAAVSLVAVYLYFTEDSMARLAGINWSAPSPIQWGVFITVSTLYLTRRHIPIFEAYYLSFIAALGGSWFYEFSPMLFHGFNWFVFFKVNAVKVFFMEFQLFCWPLLAYFIHSTKEYKAHPLLIPSAVFAIGVAALNPWIIQWAQNTLFYSYRWYVRVPTIIFLSFLLIGIKGKKQK